MSYVIYNIESTRYMPGMKRDGYQSKGAATRALNAAVAKGKRNIEIDQAWNKNWSGHSDTYKEALAHTLKGCGIDLAEFCQATNGVVKATDKADYAIADEADFHNTIELFVTRVNMMSKKSYQERTNTPCYMSPACESYWSM
jgi:hypothetical protein